MIRTLINSNQFAGIVIFYALALSPSIVHLLCLGIPVTNSWLAGGPLLAGLGLAAKFNRTLAGFLSLGTIITALIWTTNWLMMAGGNCCMTTHY